MKFLNLAAVLSLVTAGVFAKAATPQIQHKALCSIGARGQGGPLAKMEGEDFQFLFSNDSSSGREALTGEFNGFKYALSVDSKNAKAGALTVELDLVSPNGDVSKANQNVMGYYDGSSKVDYISTELTHNGQTASLGCYISQD